MPSACHVSPYSGSWYPSDAGELRELLTECFAESERRTGPWLLPQPLGFVVPHAGFRYSGTVAAAVYRHVRASRPKRIVLLGFPHRGTPQGLCIPDVSAFETPLGTVRVDEEMTARLTATGLFRRLREAMLCDHSLEIQLPLLQHASPDTELVPISVGTLDPEERRRVADLLATIIGEGTLVLASSDFTHYGSSFRYRPFPPNSLVRDRLRALDEDLAEAAGSLNVEIFQNTLNEHQSTLCGVQPIALLIEALRLLGGQPGGIYQQTLDYQTSGEIGGDFEHSVSYCALGYFRKASFTVSEDGQRRLLAAAFQALRRAVAGGSRATSSLLEQPPEIQARIPAFATLYVRDQLRGCIGSCFRPRPLDEAIPDLTVAAALSDDRFPPVRPDELEKAELEISLLTPFRRIATRQEWQAGVHGAFLRSAERRAVLLPQVATERQWGMEEFFRALARKAGVPEEVYSRPETRLSVFSAHCFRGRYTGRE